MTRAVRLGVLPLLAALLLMPEPPLSAVQESPRVRFPADVAPRNDILVDNHVPVRMRDGVTLYADVYRPTGNGRHPVILSITPYSTERFPTAYDAAVYFAQRGYVVRIPGRQGTPRVGGRLDPIRQRRERRVRHGRVGREAGVV